MAADETILDEGAAQGTTSPSLEAEDGLRETMVSGTTIISSRGAVVDAMPVVEGCVFTAGDGW